MIFATESALVSFAKTLGGSLALPAVLELVGDVGAGKTTFTRGLALGLGVSEPVSSPSFTISKRYTFPGRADAKTPGELIHYDFYRLDDPGIMSFELEEALQTPSSVVVVEWGDSVRDLLPTDRLKITFRILSDGSRELKFNGKDTYAPLS